MNRKARQTVVRALIGLAASGDCRDRDAALRSCETLARNTGMDLLIDMLAETDPVPTYDD